MAERFLLIGATGGIGAATAWLAEFAAFLMSDKAGWMTGQVSGVDGGRTTLRVKG